MPKKKVENVKVLADINTKWVDKAIEKIEDNSNKFSCFALNDASGGRHKFYVTELYGPVNPVVSLYKEFNKLPPKRPGRKHSLPWWWSKYTASKTHRIKALENFKVAILEAQKHG